MMAIAYNIEILWEELMDAFSSGNSDMAYFLDRFTGEIFHIPSSAETDEVLRHLEASGDRFLEIPRFDYPARRQVMAGFLGEVRDPALKVLLDANLSGKGPYSRMDDIMDFYPEEHSRLLEMQDDYLNAKVKTWLEENGLFSPDQALLSARL